MAHPMHSNSDDEVELNTPVPQLDQRTIPKSARDVWEVGRPASGFGQPIKLCLVNGDQVWVWRADSGDLATMRFEGFEQQRSGFFHPWIIDQLGVMKGLIARGFIARGFRIVAQQGTYCRGGYRRKGCRGKAGKTRILTPNKKWNHREWFARKPGNLHFGGLESRT